MNVDYQQIMNQMVKDSVIPVVVQPIVEFMSYSNAKSQKIFKDLDVNGQYHYCWDRTIKLAFHHLFPEQFIYINANRQPEVQIYVYLHEIGHANYRENRCRCCQNRVISEIHADLYSIETLIDLNLPKAVKCAVDYSLWNAKSNPYPGLTYYKTAARKIMKTKTFKNARIFAGKQSDP